VKSKRSKKKRMSDMVIFSMTYGQMPTRDQFARAWDKTVERERAEGNAGGVQTGTFGFGRDPRLGTCRLSRDELWAEINKAYKEASEEGGYDRAGSWISSVLYCLGIEWV
jgi:hypothetical protein